MGFRATGPRHSSSAVTFSREGWDALGRAHPHIEQHQVEVVHRGPKERIDARFDGWLTPKPDALEIEPGIGQQH